MWRDAFSRPTNEVYISIPETKKLSFIAKKINYIYFKNNEPI